MKKDTPFFHPLLALAALLLLAAGCTSRRADTADTPSRQSPKPTGNYFVFLADVHLTAKNTTGSGHDAGSLLWQATQQKIATVSQGPRSPAFILYTGDLPVHEGDGITQTVRDSSMSRMMRGLRKLAGKTTPVFYLPGNNDADSGDYCLFQGAPYQLATQHATYPYAWFNVAPTPTPTGAYMLSGAHATQGYYAAKVLPGLRLITLNSVLWSSSVCHYCPNACPLQPTAGHEQLTWLAAQLDSAARAHDQVYLAMHVPPGTDAFASYTKHTTIQMWGNDLSLAVPVNWQNEVLPLLYRYRRVVAGVFYGHTHMDEFRLLWGNPGQDTLTQVAFSSPGISPFNGNNPGFKLVSFNPQDKRPTDFTTYYATRFKSSVTWAPKPYHLSDSLPMKSGASIFASLRDATPAQRDAALKAIYTVKNDTIPNWSSYYALGMNVRLATTTAPGQVAPRHTAPRLR